MEASTCGCQKCEGGWKPLALFVSRVALALLFIVVGWNKIISFSGTAAYIGSMGVPFPEAMTVLAIIFEFGGGAMLLLGFHSRIAAKMLIVFSLIATALAHHNIADPMQQLQALKNLAIIGGLMQILIYGGGSWKIPYPKCSSKWCPDCSKGDCACCGHCGCSTCKADAPKM